MSQGGLMSFQGDIEQLRFKEASMFIKHPRFAINTYRGTLFIVLILSVMFTILSGCMYNSQLKREAAQHVADIQQYIADNRTIKIKYCDINPDIYAYRNVKVYADRIDYHFRDGSRGALLTGTVYRNLYPYITMDTEMRQYIINYIKANNLWTDDNNAGDKLRVLFDGHNILIRDIWKYNKALPPKPELPPSLKAHVPEKDSGDSIEVVIRADDTNMHCDPKRYDFRCFWDQDQILMLFFIKQTLEPLYHKYALDCQGDPQNVGNFREGSWDRYYEETGIR
jgi:hypothetical protein